MFGKKPKPSPLFEELQRSEHARRKLERANMKLEVDNATLTRKTQEMHTELVEANRLIGLKERQDRNLDVRAAWVERLPVADRVELRLDVFEDEPLFLHFPTPVADDLGRVLSEGAKVTP